MSQRRFRRLGSATAVPAVQFIELGNREGCPAPNRHESPMELGVSGPLPAGALWLGYPHLPPRRVSRRGQARIRGK